MPYEPLETKRMYLRAEAVADRVWEIVIRWPWLAKRTIGAQWVEAMDSVGANIAEAGGRFHPADVRNFLYHSRGSLRESKYWLRRSHTRKLIAEEEYTEIDAELEQLSCEINEAIKFQALRATRARSELASSKKKAK